jgi:hypothetical protein
MPHNDLGLTQSGPGTTQAGEIGYLAFTSQSTPADELKQTRRARIVPSQCYALPISNSQLHYQWDMITKLFPSTVVSNMYTLQF